MLLSVGSFYMLYVVNASVQMLGVAGSLLVSRTGLVFVVPGTLRLDDDQWHGFETGTGLTQRPRSWRAGGRKPEDVWRQLDGMAPWLHGSMRPARMA
jgi:hypothetical protein